MNKLIEIKNLTIGYEDKVILRDIDLDIFENDFLGIIGPNGGGKTTLLKAILGVITPFSGEIKFLDNGNKVDRLNIGYLPQINKIDKNFPISVHDVILSGLTLKKKLFSKYTNEQKNKAQDVAKKMGLADMLDRPIGTLSGGQLQRALLGRAIVDDPKVLVLDEPNSYVDKKFEKDFYQLLGEINKNTAIILVSHDVGTVISLVKNVACVNRCLHYHAGANISTEWLEKSYISCPIEIVGHGDFPHRVLEKHDEHDCNCSHK